MNVTLFPSSYPSPGQTEYKAAVIALTHALG